MNVVQHKNVHDFHRRAGTWLTHAEAENNLILGICSDLASNPERFTADPYLMTVDNDTGIYGAALMAPPWNLIVTRAPTAAVRFLAEYLIQADAAVPGVLGPSATANTFAQCWVERTGSRCRPGMRQRVYQCDRVALSVDGPGRMRPAVKDDLPLLVAWRGEFCREVGYDQDDNHRATVENFLADGRLYVWDHGRAVSMAGWAGETESGLRVGMVYTPPHFRGRGYASSCVASLTQLLLDSGRKRCFLAADLANPISNRIYRKIGYRPVGDNQTWHFEQSPLQSYPASR